MLQLCCFYEITNNYMIMNVREVNSTLVRG